MYTEQRESDLNTRQDDMEGNAYLLERIYDRDNMWEAYVKVVRMSARVGCRCRELNAWLHEHYDAFVLKLVRGKYRPQLARRAEIPKDNGKVRLLGIPTVVDRMVQ